MIRRRSRSEREPFARTEMIALTSVAAADILAATETNPGGAIATKQIVGSIAARENLGDTRTKMIGIAGVEAN